MQANTVCAASYRATIVGQRQLISAKDNVTSEQAGRIRYLRVENVPNTLAREEERDQHQQIQDDWQ